MDEEDNKDWLDSEEDAWLREALIEAFEEMGDDLDQDQAEQLGQDVAEDVIKGLSEECYKAYLQEDETLAKHKRELAGFQNRLQSRWGDALDLLYRFIFESFRLGAHVNRTDRLEASKQNDAVFEALTRLHARACQIASEIHTLLQAGYADGALARWRSLHETAVTAHVIAQHGSETAERFILYRHITDDHFAETYHKYYRELGYEPLSSDTLQDLRKTVQELKDRFGQSYAGYRGVEWANHLFQESASIKKLEEEAGLEHLRPYYSYASDTVHGGSKGTMERLGILDLPENQDTPELLLSGPSDAGLELPGRLTAISLHQVTAALVRHKFTASRVIKLRAHERLLDDIEGRFVDEAENLKTEAVRAQEERAEMGIVDIALTYLGLEKLLTGDFLNEFSEFDSLEGFRGASPVDLPSKGPLNNGLGETLNPFISKSTEFSTFDDMIEEAFEVWVRQNVDLDEFSDS